MTIEVGLSNNPDIDGILWGWEWGAGTRPIAQNLTFSFPAAVTAGTVGEYTGYSQIDNFTAFNATQMAAVRAILANVASFTNLTFTETGNAGATLRYGNAIQINYTTDATVAGHTGLHVPGGPPNSTAEANPPELGFTGAAPYSPGYAQGDSWYSINNSGPTPILNYGNPLLGSFQYAAGIMHETGHNLGLKHGHITQNGHGITFPMLPADHNSYEYSVMTYSQFPGDQPGAPNNVDNAPNHPTTFMQDDILALQWLYGANYGATAHNTNTTYTWDPKTGQEFVDGAGQGAPQSNFVLMTVWDGGGTDTYDFSNYTTNLSVDLNPGQWIILDTSAAHAQRADLGNNQAGGAEYFARGNIANALIDPNNPTETASLIENANGGSGNDTINGNAANNVFKGNGGNDTMDGRDGSDTAVYSAARANYTASFIGGSIQIIDNRVGSPDGTDTDTSIESFLFSDGTYTAAQLLNKPPVLSPDIGSPNHLTERFGLTNSTQADTTLGTLPFTDVDIGDTHTASASEKSATWSAGAVIPVATQAALAGAMTDSITVDGTAGTLRWNFSLLDKFVDFLAANETLTIVYNVTVTDHFGPSNSLSSGSSIQPVTIVFSGTNDAPTIDLANSKLSGSVHELPNKTDNSTLDLTSGAVIFSDPDLSDRATTATVIVARQAVIWQDGSHDFTSELMPDQIALFESAFTINAATGNTNVGTINWKYSITDNELDFLAFDESVTITNVIEIFDRNGAPTIQSIVITLSGANDNPTANSDSNAIAKGLTRTDLIGVLSNDTDPDVHDQDDLFVSAVGGSTGNVGHKLAGSYGSLTLKSDGTYAYVANQGSLPAKIVAQDVFQYTVSDGHGGTDTASLYMVVTNPGVTYQKAELDATLTGGNGPDVLDGSAGSARLFGGSGPDVLIGGNGDTLTGGNSPDTYLFRPDFGKNTIVDFNVHADFVQFDKSIFKSINDILNHISDNTDGDAVINAGLGNTITMVGVQTEDLNSSVFLIA